MSKATINICVQVWGVLVFFSSLLNFCLLSFVEGCCKLYSTFFQGAVKSHSTQSNNHMISIQFIFLANTPLGSCLLFYSSQERSLSQPAALMSYRVSFQDHSGNSLSHSLKLGSLFPESQTPFVYATLVFVNTWSNSFLGRGSWKKKLFETSHVWKH